MSKNKITAILLSAFLLCQNVCADNCNYYIVRQKDHKRPVLDSCFSYMTEHGGRYIGADEKVIYLTFDAGYENGNVERIVDTLDRHNAKGTFFVLDNIIRRNTDLIIKMADNGHTVANHTAHHKDMSKLQGEAFEQEITGLESIYNELTGKKMSKFFRPPEGRFNENTLKQAEAMGYKTIFWSFAYADWDNNKQPDPEYAVKLILDNTHNGEIILLHPTSKTNADILDRLLCEWENLGYRFGSLEEIE